MKTLKIIRHTLLLFRMTWVWGGINALRWWRRMGWRWQRWLGRRRR